MDTWEKIYWCAWKKIYAVGPKRFELLRRHFGSMQNAWEASDSEIAMALGAEKSQNLEEILKTKSQTEPDANWQAMEKHQVKAVTLLEPEYPKLLKEIHSAPPVLFFKGELPKAEEICLAVVGTRAMTNFGKTATDLLVEPLAQAGLAIISGLALGIDGEAHKTALNAGGQTFAVVGSGLDQTYPPQHKQLSEEMLAKGGGIMSEFTIGTPALPHHFPLRNRIIAGLAKGTLIIEAGEKSGALLTARNALDENREVFAVPGDFTRPSALGPNQLIKLGATTVTKPEDVLNVFELKTTTATKPKALPRADTPEEELIIKNLVAGAKHVDELSSLCDLDPSIVNATLIMLELKGRIRHLGGLQYEII
ncbi:DNA-protecting protein DprA [Candidatus Parcubacteria bacterium]|jgi:DNA processing protein|nr:MAG: DNA-protecting protein DprA [Candidatus Parcubacteria bacterium]